MKESVLQSHVIHMAEWFQCRVYHVSNVRGQLRSQTSVGYPDLTIVGKRGVIFRELKSERGRLTQAQDEWQDHLKQAGQNVGVWRPRDWVSGLIELELRRMANQVKP